MAKARAEKLWSVACNRRQPRGPGVWKMTTHPPRLAITSKWPRRMTTDTASRTHLALAPLLDLVFELRIVAQVVCALPRAVGVAQAAPLDEVQRLGLLF